MSNNPTKKISPLKRDLLKETYRRDPKETYKRNLQKEPTKETHTYRSDIKRDIQKGPTKKTYKTDVQNRTNKKDINQNQHFKGDVSKNPQKRPTIHKRDIKRDQQKRFKKKYLQKRTCISKETLQENYKRDPLPTKET